MYSRICRTRRSSASDHSSPNGLPSNLCQKGRGMSPGPFTFLSFACKTGGYLGALGRTRTCAFIGDTALLKRHGGTRRDSRLRSDCGQFTDNKIHTGTKDCAAVDVLPKQDQRQRDSPSTRASTGEVRQSFLNGIIVRRHRFSALFIRFDRKAYREASRTSSALFARAGRML